MGKNIKGSDFEFDFKIMKGAVPLSAARKRLCLPPSAATGDAHTKPPFPAQKGFRKQPTNINNVETFANVPWIIENGGEAFAAMGTEDSKGTKVFALAGKVKYADWSKSPWA